LVTAIVHSGSERAAGFLPRKNAVRRCSAMAAPDRDRTMAALSPLLPVEQLPQLIADF